MPTPDTGAATIRRINMDCLNCPQAVKHPFCNVSVRARAFLEANSIPMEYRRGNILFREGDECSVVFVMCSGKVKVSAGSSQGRSFTLRIAGEGDVLGMEAVLHDNEYEVTAEATERCQVRVLRAKFFKQMLHEFADVGMGVARALSEDYRAAFDEACLIALPGSSAGKLARLILDWSADAKREGTGSTVTMALTHDELASMIVSTRETVTRTLGRFRKEQLISTNGVSLTVLQPEVLRQLASV
jgi:CRP/FNR family transcriptional regulator, cyclic AMP receptor protein